MTNSFTLGKDGNFGNIDFNKLRSGITKKDLGIEGDTVLSNIFDSIDNAEDGENKGNGKLERNELLAFINKIRELAGKDSNVSANEAKNYEINGEKLGKNKEDLLTFISKLAELTKGVKNVSINSGAEIITYEDGHTEQIFADGSKIITVKNGNKTTVTKKNSDEKTTEETIEENGTATKTEYEEGSTNPKKQTITNQDSETVILYSNGKKISQKVTNKQTGEVQEFGFDDNGNPVLKKSTKSGEETSYTGGVPSKKTTTTQTDEGTRVSNITYDGNNSTENVSIDGKIRYQKKVINGVEYEVHYDENGNTLGVIVQNGESIQAIAKKFGVTPEALVKANANLLKGKRYFNVGDEIKIPRIMEADEYSKAQEGRLDKQGAVQQFNADAARRKAEAERREAERQAKIGDEIARGQNGYYVTKTSDGNLHYWNPNKKEISPEEFKKVCPSIYENVTQTQRGATKRTRNKYDIPTIKRQAGDLAKKIHSQIDGASINENTVNLLRGITQENVAFVISEYQRMYNVSLAKDIDDEWGLDINTVKEHICKKLVDQAKSLGIQGIYYGDYQKINDLNSLQNWINKASSKIISTMSNAKETYYATEAEETQRQQSRELQKTAKTEAEQIVNDLIKETSGINDVDKIKNIIRRIDKPEEMAEVNRLLTLKGYPPTDKYSAIENYIYQEANNSIVHTYNSSDYLEQTVQEWINNGTLKGQAANEAQARMAARVLYDGGDGFGTDPDKIKKAVRMIKCPKPTGNREADNKQAREVYRLVNNMIKKHNTFYGLGSPSTDLLDYCRGELWESEVKYLNGILAETNAIKGQEKAQAVSDLTEEAVSGAGTDIEYLEQAIRGIDSPEDRKAIEAKLKEYCQKKGIKLQIAGQSYLQAILYDECDTFMGISTDHKEIRKFNEMLISQGAYTEEEIINLRAEQAALQILEGKFSDIKDAVEQIKDKKVLAKLEQLLTTKGYKSLDDFLSQKLNSTKSDLINAELASNNLLANEKAADVAYRLMKNSDFDNRAMGVKAIRNEVVAKMVDEKLKKDGSSLAKFMEQFNKEKAEYKSKADFWDGLGKFIPVVGSFAEDISDAYRENTDSSDNMFVEMQSAQPLTPQQKAAYQMTVKLMEQKLAQMEKDYQAALDSQGAVSWAVNRFCENYGIGTTREEIQARIEHDRETVRLLKLAADGKLGKMENGKTVAVSFEAVFKERNIGTDFDTSKVEKVQQQAEMLGAMDYAKTNIAICWQEIDNGLNSTDAKRLTVAILDTLDKLSAMTGRELSLAGYGYKVKDSIIFDSADNPVPPEKLRELANQLKQGLADVAKDLLGQEIPLNTSSSKINEVLEDAYNSKKESFKQEFKDAFGQDAPDEIIDSYISTINTGKTIINFGAIIGAAIAAPFTGGGSLAVFAAVAGTSFGLNALEKSTDANGYTNSEWTADMEQALWDGALAAVGMKVGKYAEGFALGTKVDSALLKNLLTKNTNMLSKVIKDPKALQSATQTLTRIEANGYKITLQMAEKMSPTNAKIASKFITNPENYKTAMVWIARVEAAGIEVTSDTLQSFLQMYCQEGHFDEASFITGLIMSVGGNALGHTVGAVTDLKGTKSIHDGVHGSTDTELPPNHPHTTEADAHPLDNVIYVDEPKPKVSYAYTEPSKSVVSALFAKLPSVSLRKAGEQILEKIKNLKNLVDYQEIKNKIETFYQNYKEVKEQLLDWLDEKFKTIGKIIKHENYNVHELNSTSAFYETKTLITTHDKKSLNNALKQYIKNDNLREVVLKKIMNGEDFNGIIDGIEYKITYSTTGKTHSIFVKSVDLDAKAKAGATTNVGHTPSSHIQPDADVEIIGLELPLGQLKLTGANGQYLDYVLDFSKFDKIQIGNVEIDFNDPKLKQLMSELKDGESFAIGCTNPQNYFADVKYQIGKFEDGVGSHHLVITKKGSEFTISAHKPASVIKDIPTKPSTNPSVAKKIAEIKSHGTTSVQKSLNIDGKEVPFEILEGYTQGSNGGYYAINKLTGDLYFIKEGAGTKSEIAAAKLYEAAGVDVPEISYFKSADGTRGMISKFVPDITPVTGACAAANDAFGMNVLLANWDAVISDNTCLTKEGKAILIDCGGTLDHHAHQASLKPFTSIPTEILTLMDGHHNWGATQVYSLMTREDLIKSLQKAVNLDTNTIKQTLSNMGMSHYAKTIIERQNFLKTLLDKIENTPMNGKSMYQYLEDSMCAALKDCIDNAKSLGTIQDIESALSFISESNKIKLQKLLDTKKAYIVKHPPKPKVMTGPEIVNFLGVQKNVNGEYVLNVDSALETNLLNHFGYSTASPIIKKIKKPLTKKDISNIQTLLNKAATIMDVSDIEPYKLLILYRNILAGDSDFFTKWAKELKPEKCAMILNIAKGDLISSKQLEAFANYKGSQALVNGALSNLKDNGIPPTGEAKEQIEALSSYISTQQIPESMVVYRSEGFCYTGSSDNAFGCLRSCQLSGDYAGKTMDQVMAEINSITDPKAKKQAYLKLRDAVQDNDYVAINERFMSGSLMPTGLATNGDVTWELHLQKDSHAVFLEGNNMTGSIGHECELLLQNGAELSITDIVFDEKKNQWKVVADVKC